MSMFVEYISILQTLLFTCLRICVLFSEKKKQKFNMTSASFIEVCPSYVYTSIGTTTCDVV